MLRKNSKGFSLIELTIVVAIIGILAMVAIPSYLSHIREARIAEAKANLGEIKVLQESYMAVNDAYLTCAAAPGAVPGNTKGTWVTNANWTALGFTPSGDVWFQYTATGNASSFTATAVSDMDGDGALLTLTVTNNTGVSQSSDSVY